MRDEWLVGGREALKEQSKLSTRARTIEADGSWKPKLEEKAGDEGEEHH